MSLTRADELRARVADVPFWWHSIELGDGIVTPGAKTPALLRDELASLALPDLRGRTVLDIGGWDGYFAFAAEQRGARRVAVLDHDTWSLELGEQQAYWQRCREEEREPRHYKELPFWRPDTMPGRRGFDLARDALESRVEALALDFTTCDLSQVGTWDVTLFLGVLYHLEDPLGAARRLAQVTGDVAIVETAAIIVDGYEDVPLWRTFPGAELNGDSSNWWAPNAAGLEAVLRAAGFARVTVQHVHQPSAGVSGAARLVAQAHRRPR